MTTFVYAGANLTPDARNFTIEIGYVGEDTEVQDGCIPNGTHNLLRFDFLSKNIGDADFTAGKPIDRPDLFYYHLSHHHFHMREFNQYKLMKVNGSLTIPSTKPGFCLADVEQVLPNAGPQKYSLTCAQGDVMGISAGWADVYSSDLTCQYLVIDDVPDGDYILEVTTNAARKVPEDTYDDNTISKGLHIEGGTVWEIALPSGVPSMGSPTPTQSSTTSLSQASSTSGVPALSATASATASAIATQQASVGAKASFTLEFFIISLVAGTISFSWTAGIW